MKIIYIYDAIARIGGTEKILVDKMNLLADVYNQKVYLITTCQGNHSMAFPLSKKIEHTDLSVRYHTIYHYSLLKRLYKINKMNKELKVKLNNIVNKINPDIIIATSYYAADIVCRINYNAAKIVESHSVRGYNEDHINKYTSFFKKIKEAKYYKTIEKYSDAIITLTKGDAKQWNTDKIRIIPNSVDMHPTVPSQLTNKTAIYTGRISKIKGLDRMLKAWSLVVDKHNDWILKIVGDGEEKEKLRQLCKQLNIENNTIFIPATKDVIKEYLSSSIFLLTSISEGFSLVMIEAMQCGVPCISFDCPYGPADIIDDGKIGYLIEDGNVEKFAQAVIKLIENEELRKEMGMAAIEKSKKFLPEQIMPKWIKLFEELQIKK